MNNPVVVGDFKDGSQLVVSYYKNCLAPCFRHVGPQDAQYAFYLFRAGKKINARWYSSENEASFECGDGAYKISVFVKSNSNKVFTETSDDFFLIKGVIKKSTNSTAVSALAPSFNYLLSMESRKAVLGDCNYAWVLDSKVNAYLFSDLINLPRPDYKVYQSFNEVDFRTGTVIKPISGVLSRGVFLLRSNGIYDVGAMEWIEHLDSLRDRIVALPGGEKLLGGPWLSETLYFSDKHDSEPARDIKFYTFYGKVMLVLETVREPIIRRCWYNGKGQIVQTGKYDNLLFEGEGVSSDLIDLAEQVSLKIPVPFIRIDFLRAAKGYILNEFTPKPSGANEFSKMVDQQLGKEILAAQGRLTRDLLEGKKFSEFLTLLDEVKCQANKA